MKQKLTHTAILALLIFSLQGCGAFTLVTTAISGVMIAQEVEEEYEGSFQEYVVDKASTTYEYIERKTTTK